MKKQMRMAKNRMPPILASIKAESEPFFIGSPSEGKWGLFQLRGRHHSFPFHSKNIAGCGASFLKHILGLWYMRFIRIKNLLGIPSPFGCQADAPPPKTLNLKSKHTVFFEIKKNSFKEKVRGQFSLCTNTTLWWAPLHLG